MTPEFGGHRDGVTHLSRKSKGEKLVEQAGAGREGAALGGRIPLLLGQGQPNWGVPNWVSLQMTPGRGKGSNRALIS